MSGRRRAAAALAAVSLLLTACGARIDGETRDQAAEVAMNGGSGGGGGGGAGGEVVGGSGESAGAIDTGGTAGDTSGTTGGTAGGTAGTTGGGKTAGKTGKAGTQAQQQAPAPAGGNGGATDVGITATTITVGNVADLSGPVPGLFRAAPNGVDAFFAYINSQGGIYGRQLRVVGADSQTDCTQSQNAHKSLVTKVFAFVGSFSLYDDCGSRAMEAFPDVADVSYALGPRAKKAKNNFNPAPAPLGYQSGMFAYYAKEFGAKVKKVGSLCPNIPSAYLSHQAMQNAARTVGWDWVYDERNGATQTRFDAELLQMQREGVEVVFISCQNAANAAEMKREADAQGFKPKWIVPIAYASDFIERIGSPQAAEGIVGWNLYSLFFNADEAKTIPEVALYQQWMQKTHPGDAYELYSMYAWAAARLFVQAVKAAGPKLTREGLLTALRKTGKYDSNKLILPGEPALKKPSNCYVLWELKGGKYLRKDSPPGQYRCDGGYVMYNGG